MKNKFMFWKILLIVAGGLIMASTMGCPTDTTDDKSSTTDIQKSLHITGASGTSFDVAIVPVGTLLSDMQTKRVASSVNLTTSTLADGFPLYSTGGGDVPWTGNGTFNT